MCVCVCVCVNPQCIWCRHGWCAFLRCEFYVNMWKCENLYIFAVMFVACMYVRTQVCLDLQCTGWLHRRSALRLYSALMYVPVFVLSVYMCGRVSTGLMQELCELARETTFTASLCERSQRSMNKLRYVFVFVRVLPVAFLWWYNLCVSLWWYFPTSMQTTCMWCLLMLDTCTQR